jgi:uncharacterized coiled-coil DUF342 family protein
VDQSAVSARLIGLMFVEKGLITEEQLEVALEKQRETGDRLGEILVSEFGVERLDLAGALAEQWAEYEREGSAEELEQHGEKRDLVAVSDEWRGDAEPTQAAAGKRPIGEIFVERGLISAAQLEDALEEQKESGRRLGEILVATGRLTRLELASALADQWASFQKLRPPGEEAPSEARMVPMPVASLPPTSAPPSPELTRRVDELATRIEELSARDVAAVPAGEGAADALVARVDQLESSLAATEPVELDELRSQLAEVTARIESLPTETGENGPSIEWRSELAEVAGNLRTRIERVEQGLDGGPRAADVTELRESIEALAVRIDSLPAPSEEWREPLAELAARMDAQPAPEWRPELEKVAEKLRGRMERLEQAADSARAAGDDIELRGQLDELAARFDSLPAPSEEWREPLIELRSRLDALPSGEWRPELAEVAENLRTRIERVEQSAHDERAAAEIGELRTAVEELRSQLACTSAEIAAASGQSGEWRVELAEVAGNLRTRLERVEQTAADGHATELDAELRSSVEALQARVDGLPAGLSEEWRESVAELAARLDALPQGEWKHELAELAGDLRARLERVEERAAGNGNAAEEIGQLHASIEALGARVDALPAGPFEEWREPLAELAQSLHSRLERVELGAANGQSAADVADLRSWLEALQARVDGLPAGVSEEWRDPLTQLAARLDALPSREWRPELADVAESLRARLDQVEQSVASGHGSGEIAELRVALEALAARADALPEPSDEWREPLTELARRVDGLAAPADGWRDEFAALAARVDAIPASDDGHAGELAEIVNELSRRVDQAEHGLTSFSGESLDRLRARIEEVAAKVGETDGVEARLRESLAALADERVAAAADSANAAHRRLDEFAGGSDRSAHRVEELAHHVEQLATRRDASDVEQSLGQRIGELEGALDGLREGLAGLPPSVEERLAEVNERAAAAAGQAAADVASLRHEIEELRFGVEAARTDAADRVDAAADALRSEVEATARHAVESVADDVRAAVQESAARVQHLAGELASAEQRGAGRSADLSALRARLETVESALGGGLGWHDAVDSANARVESLELHVTESLAAEAVERDDQIETLRAELDEQAGAFQRERVKRKELRELRDIIERVDRRLEKRRDENAAAARATESAVRKGIESMAGRLTASGEAYLDTGRELSRSIAGLGMALAASDALRVAEPRETDSPNENAVFLAFAPTAEGYRLLECEGSTPTYGSEMSIDGCEGPLVVTRIGASPLPFDRRPCVYLEPAA